MSSLKLLLQLLGDLEVNIHGVRLHLHPNVRVNGDEPLFLILNQINLLFQLSDFTVLYFDLSLVLFYFLPLLSNEFELSVDLVTLGLQ